MRTEGSVRRVFPRLMEIGLDRWLGIETRVEVGADVLGYDGHLCQPYAASSWFALPIALGLRRRPRDVFVDVGAGKGRIVLQAAILYGFRRVVGIERDLHLASLARNHVTRNQRRLKGSLVDVITDEIAAFRFPEDTTVVYTFNPVRDQVFAAFLANLLDLADRRHAPVTFIYYHPFEHAQVIDSGRATLRLSRPPSRLLAMAPLNVYDIHPKHHGRTTAAAEPTGAQPRTEGAASDAERPIDLGKAGKRQ